MNKFVSVPFIIASLTIFPALAEDVDSEVVLADGFLVEPAGEITWYETDEYAGLEFAFLVGNPNEEGPYVLRARFRPGVFSMPHAHSTDRHATVISGTWYAGTGTAFDKDKTVALHPGDFMIHPAGGMHFDGAKDEIVVVQISGMGPVTTTFADNPE